MKIGPSTWVCIACAATATLSMIVAFVAPQLARWSAGINTVCAVVVLGLLVRSLRRLP